MAGPGPEPAVQPATSQTAPPDWRRPHPPRNNTACVIISLNAATAVCSGAHACLVRAYCVTGLLSATGGICHEKNKQWKSGSESAETRDRQPRESEESGAQGFRERPDAGTCGTERQVASLTSAQRGWVASAPLCPPAADCNPGQERENPGAAADESRLSHREKSRL